MLRSTLLLLLMLSCIPAYGQQLSFNKVKQDEATQLQFQWLDKDNNKQNLTFNLSNQIIQQHSANRANYMPDIAQRFIYIELMKQAQKIDPREARVKIQRLGKDIRIKVKSNRPEMYDKWFAEMRKNKELAFENYLFQNYYAKYETHLGQKGIKPDHIRYLKESKDDLLSVAQGLYELLPQGSDARTYVNMMLGWIQTIPYDTLEDRLVSNGSGYFSPVEVLANNRGDCDSKTTLAASLLRALFPELSMVMIYLPNHALLGANLSRRSSEKTVTIKGIDYLLIEPTGPALLAAGMVAQSTLNDIASGMYTYEKIP